MQTAFAFLKGIKFILSNALFVKVRTQLFLKCRAFHLPLQDTNSVYQNFCSKNNRATLASSTLYALPPLGEWGLKVKVHIS